MYKRNKLIIGDVSGGPSLAALIVASKRDKKYIQTAGFCEYGWARDSDERKELLNQLNVEECSIKGCQAAMTFNIRLLTNHSPFADTPGGTMKHLNYLYANKTGLLILKQESCIDTQNNDGKSLIENIVPYYDNFDLFNHKNIDRVVQVHKDSMHLNYLQVIDRVPRHHHGYFITEDRNTMIIWYNGLDDIDTEENRIRIKEFIEPLSKVLVTGTILNNSTDHNNNPFVSLFDHVL